MSAKGLTLVTLADVAKSAGKEIGKVAEVLVNQITELTRVLMGICLKKCAGFDRPPSYKHLFEMLMKCDLSRIELGNEIQKLMPTAQFFVRTFGLKLGRSVMPADLLEDIRQAAYRRNA